MSRSWERAVRKNTKQINRQRKKTGKPALAATASEVSVIRGRSWMFASFLLMVSLFLLITQAGTPVKDGMYWFTVISYGTLALIIFLWRRPYLKVYKNQLATRKLTGEKYASPSDIEKITVLPGYAIVHLKGKRSWVFSKLIHMYSVEAMAEKLREFSTNNQIVFQMETRTKGK